MSTDTYDLAELCDLADVTPRTVRYYVQQGLLPSPGARGPGAPGEGRRPCCT
jgi:DNA-binding transcriptional MerR regulator